MDNLWIFHPDTYSELENESRKLVLNPKIAELIKIEDDIKILDYGCGDGSLIKNLPTSIDASLFDISGKALEIAKRVLSAYNPKLYYEIDSIPKNHYDYVILSLVIMTLSSMDDILSTLKNIAAFLKHDATAIIAITHPCFRQNVFSTFHTSYSDDKSFNYFKEGDKFKVNLRDSKDESNVSFYDYHWSLSTTINLILESGLTLTNVVELKDYAKKGFFNTNFPPYLLFSCKKK